MMASLTEEQKEVMKDATENVRLVGMGEPIRGRVEIQNLEVPDFWVKHKNKAWVAILLVVGALGGNIDEVYKAIPDVHDVKSLKVRVDNIEKDVKILKEGNDGGSSTFVPPSDNGFRAERPK